MGGTDILLPTVIGMTLGLIVFVASAVRSGREPDAAVIRRGGMTGLLVYAVIAAPVLARTGLTLLGLAISVLFLALPLVATTLAQRRGSAGDGTRWAGAVVGTGLAAFTLIAAGQTFALVGKVDPRTTVVVVAVMAALVVVATGLAGSSRAGSTALWLTVVPILICLGLGLALGGPGELVPPLIETTGPGVGSIVALGVAFVVLGWADHALTSLHVAGNWGTSTWLAVRVFLGTAVIVLLLGLGLLMFLGGSVIAPSLQFFVVPANLEIIPVLAVVVMAVGATLFATLMAVILSGVGALGGDDPSRVDARWVAVGAGVAVVVALLDPTSDGVVAVAALAGAALLGADLAGSTAGRGVVAGLLTAAVATGVLMLTGTLGFDWPLVAAIAAVLVVASAVARVDTRRTRTLAVTPETGPGVHRR